MLGLAKYLKSFGLFFFPLLLLLIVPVSCEEELEKNEPLADFSVNYETGNMYTCFLFDASSSTDAEDPVYLLKVRWDWESDGVWDTKYLNNKVITHTFKVDGNYTVLAEVMDTDGLTSQQSLQITVHTVIGEPGSFTDERNSREYQTIQIGNQVWMAENLYYGEFINSSTESADNQEVEMYNYENNQTMGSNFGGLYKWEEMMNYDETESTQGICPAGWHIPSDQEWSDLESYLGLNANDCNDCGWRGCDQGYQMHVGCSSHFDAIFSGVMSPDGRFLNVGEYTTFWTSSKNAEGYIYRTLGKTQKRIYRNAGDMNYAYSVRCVKN